MFATWTNTASLIFPFQKCCKITARFWSVLWAVWPDWEIFDSSLPQNLEQKLLNCLVFFCYFEKPHFYVKITLATFRATFGYNWATFHSNIWSHWKWGAEWFCTWTYFRPLDSTSGQSYKHFTRKGGNNEKMRPGMAFKDT